MHLLPREIDKLLISQVGTLAQKRLARGLRLNLAEATGLICAVLHELIRDGNHTVAELMSIGASLHPSGRARADRCAPGRSTRAAREGSG